MAEGTLVAIKSLLANGEIARFGIRCENPVSGPLSFDDLTDVADAAQTALAAHDDLFSTDMLLGLCTAQGFDHETPAPPKAPYWKPTSAEALSSIASVNGTAVGESAPPQVALAVTLRTAGAGRSKLGRVFTFPPPESQVDSDGTVLDAGARAGMVQDIIDAIAAVPVGGGLLVPAVFSAKLDSSEPILQVAANSRVDTQRRRLQR